MMSSGRVVAVIRLGAVGLIVLVAASCSSSGGGSSTTTTAAPTTTTVAPATTTTTAGGSAIGAEPLDPCVIGTWTTVSVVFVVPFDDGTTVQLTGGAGDTITVGDDGSYADDTSALEPVTGSDAAGSHYEATITGNATGTATTTADGHLKTTIEDTTTQTITVSQDGQQIASQHPSPTDTVQYQCVADTSLTTINSDGTTVTYAPG